MGRGQRGIVHRSHCHHPSQSTLRPLHWNPPMWLCPYTNILPHNTHACTESAAWRRIRLHRHGRRRLNARETSQRRRLLLNTHTSLAILSLNINSAVHKYLDSGIFFHFRSVVQHIGNETMIIRLKCRLSAFHMFGIHIGCLG